MNTKDLSETNLKGLRFDYNQVPSSLASFLKGQADRIRKQCVTSIIQIGKALNESKRHLSHGAFLNWVECEVCLPARTAQAYMKVASWAADKSAAVAHLSPSTLYVLSASNTPSEYVAKILSRAENGEIIPHSAIRSELKALKSVQHGPGNLREAKMLRVVQKPAFSKNLGERANPGCLEELVVFLARILSPADFERVRELVTSEAVLSDPRLPETLLRVFSFPEGLPQRGLTGTRQSSLP
jgi:hypothetical protein